MQFANRVEAGRRLAGVVAPLIGGSRSNVVVLGLPRGGVPVAFELAAVLQTPLDVILVRKVGVPEQPELAMGAVGEDGVRVVNHHVVHEAHVDADVFERVAARERDELDRRAVRIRQQHARVPLSGKTAVIVDDGIATGSTVRAACAVARAHGAEQIIVAAPVAPPSTIAALRDVADDVIVVETPRQFQAIGQFYDDFSATTDEEVVALLRHSRRPAQ